MTRYWALRNLALLNRGMNPDTQTRYIASGTKILTLLIANDYL
ncbi:hypothetical protein [Chlorogloeopsis fritschii]|nr:hypothetical protein [Chlorogloeopsis fritschii]